MILLSDEWRIRPDSHCWVLEKKTTRQETFEETWQNKGYYPLMEDALKSACNQQMKRSRSIDGLLQKIDSLKEMIRSLYPNVYPPKLESDSDMDFLN